MNAPATPTAITRATMASKGPMPNRIQLLRTRGWRMPPDAVKVDRSTRWGNPFRVHGDGYAMDPANAVDMFRKMLESQGGFLARVTGQGTMQTTVSDIRRELRGKSLACWCALDQPCHADVLLELANEESSR